MERVDCSEREQWQEKAERIGFYFHSIGDGYWHERAYYRFSAREVDLIEEATAELHQRCLEAVDHIVRKDWFERLAIPLHVVPHILRSWVQREPALYGRFDLAFDGERQIKMLEYNADTPTSLLEASVMQWDWLRDRAPRCDQFNSLHERLVAAWGKRVLPGQLLHFAALKGSDEDLGTIEYLRDTAIEAGMATRTLFVDEIAWEQSRQCFVDTHGSRIDSLFKLYPWEWMIHDPFYKLIEQCSVRVIEPAWKMLLSNKAILPILWELFPGHPHLLPAYFEPERLQKGWVKKPFLSREGANITIHSARGDEDFCTDGDYGQEGYIYQQLFPLPKLGGKHPVIGSWVVDDAPAGMGIREDSTLVTKNTSWFVPHCFEVDRAATEVLGLSNR
jgi:glutathionylspermidine synthase